MNGVIRSCQLSKKVIDEKGRHKETSPILIPRMHLLSVCLFVVVSTVCEILRIVATERYTTDGLLLWRVIREGDVAPRLQL